MLPPLTSRDRLNAKRLGFPDALTLGMRTSCRLAVVNRRQKGVFAPSQNKTKQVEKTPKERTSERPRQLKVAQKVMGEQKWIL